ncbi:MAG TPA: hypothetical protein PLR41_15740 [Alphaproteobacteria bacterium]|nr:hypothetical protein [Alphaproteobacteria bacterium]
MIPSQPKPPTGSAITSTSEVAGQDARAERLSAALRDNLQRRKAQQRARRNGADSTAKDGPAGTGEAE